MVAPKRRLSKTRKDSRRSHDALVMPPISLCSECGKPKKSHVLCGHCGYYNGIQYKPGVED